MLELEMLNNLMQEVKGKFIAGAERRLSSMLSTLERLEQSPADAAALSDLKNHFHNLAGTGSADSFPHLTTLGRVGARECGAMLAEQSFPGAVELKRWRGFWQTMREELTPEKEVGGPSLEKAPAVAEQTFEILSSPWRQRL